MRTIVIFLLRAYKLLLSPFLGNHCRFYPSCSTYAETGVRRFGVPRGMWLTLCRLSKCHPWHAGGVDPVPKFIQK